MSFSAPFIAFQLAFAIFIGTFAMNLMDRKSDLENSVLACLKQASLTGSAECDKAVAAKAKALEAATTVFLPRG
ncbi:hypothetical protein [Pseudomonas sp. NMI795_08]|uniref:hypothetical protein n=1 Tax=Pseudomonas sp. NMI795_08 TaxID=2903144 RepID=UPI001E62679E|nr:hypothetical protein [Pseudomonas sp. NMI795_08]MCE1117469.1 hypothetical protein [Pseudomonas sp. NMI795_08]